MSQGALSGTRILDCSELVAGPYCCKLLADLGAEVTKVEKPEGDEARRRGPFPDDLPHPERSGLFLYLNANKLGITLNAAGISGQKLLRRLAKESDVLVESDPFLSLRQACGITDEWLFAENPNLVIVSISPFGRTGPYRNYRSYYLTTYNSGGEAYCLPAGLGWLMFPERPPVRAGGFVGEYDAGVGAAVGLMGALWGRESATAGQHVDVSQQEVLLGLWRYELAKFNEGWVECRATRGFVVGGMMQCKDGFVLLMPQEEHHWDGLLEAMGAPDWSKEPRFQWPRLVQGHMMGATPPRDLVEERQQANDRIEEWALRQTGAQLLEMLQAHGCPVGTVSTVEDLVQSPHLKARGFFRQIEHPDAGLLSYAGSPWKLSQTPATLRRPAPRLGEHNREVYCERLGYRRDELVRLRQGGIV